MLNGVVGEEGGRRKGEGGEEGEEGGERQGEGGEGRQEEGAREEVMVVEMEMRSVGGGRVTQGGWRMCESAVGVKTSLARDGEELLEADGGTGGSNDLSVVFEKSKTGTRRLVAASKIAETLCRGTDATCEDSCWSEHLGALFPLTT